MLKVITDIRQGLEVSVILLARHETAADIFFDESLVEEELIGVGHVVLRRAV